MKLRSTYFWFPILCVMFERIITLFFYNISCYDSMFWFQIASSLISESLIIYATYILELHSFNILVVLQLGAIC